MIRFVDLTNAYWTFLEHTECSKPICAFLDTITEMGVRCASLLPDGFFGTGEQQ